LQNPLAVSVLRRLYNLDQDVKLDLEAKFRVHDQAGTGMIKKGDFVNLMFESCVQGGIQASELLGLVNLFTASFDEIVNYDDFLRLLYKMGGEIPQANPGGQGS
jgi:Ca2+-binding EF-hand superfamily protein